ncbi:MAG: type II secretion system GspH family protein [Planctomycetia bacterium]|nr:type II secretion system GspH family protein [Planctomycetia bacterium]
MKSNRRNAFTLIEILIVVVIMAVLAATIIPQFTDSTKDAKESTALLNLNTLRSQVELFKAQHGGALPNATLTDLTTATTYNGKTYGPYMQQLPTNPITNSAAVKPAGGATIVVGDLTSGGGGWIYSSTSGEVRLDDSNLYTK